jgi:hypothetical protein
MSCAVTTQADTSSNQASKDPARRRRGLDSSWRGYARNLVIYNWGKPVLQRTSDVSFLPNCFTVSYLANLQSPEWAHSG